MKKNNTIQILVGDEGKKSKILPIIFTILTILFVIHSIITIIPIVTKDNGMSFFGKAQDQVVAYNSTKNDDNKYKLSTVWYQKSVINDVKDGDFIIIQENDNNCLLVVKVVKNEDNLLAVTNNDNGPIMNIDESVVTGTLVKDQTVFGLIHYTSTSIVGYIFLTLVKVFILFLLLIKMCKKESPQFYNVIGG